MSAETFPALVFNWDPPRRRQRAIMGFIALSAGLHALCFYLFQIVYPPTVALLPPPARVNVISANSEQGRVLLRWIEAEDPAVAATTQRPKDSRTNALPAVRHVPSYLTAQPVLKDLPPMEQRIIAPSAQPPAPVPISRQKKPAGPPVAVETVVRFSDGGNDLGALEKPAMHFVASSKETPQAARFLASVSGRGEIRFCFLQESSGDAALDEQARKYLALCRFLKTDKQNSAGENELVWVTATFEWGNDIAAPPTTRSTIPSPAGSPASTP